MRASKKKLTNRTNLDASYYIRSVNRYFENMVCVSVGSSIASQSITLKQA